MRTPRILYRDQSGLTLFEVVIGLGIIVILATFLVLNLGAVRPEQDLNLDAKIIVASLRDAKQRAITGEDGSKWGIYFKADDNSYRTFRGDSYQAGGEVSRRNLKPTVEFGIPSVSVIFEKLSGKVLNPVSVLIILKNDTSKLKTITINKNGTITY